MRFINIHHILDIHNHHRSLLKWIEMSNKKYITIKKKTIQQYFHQYIRLIKPIIHHFYQLTSKLNPQQYSFYSDTLTMEQLTILQQIYKPLQKFMLIAQKSPNQKVSDMEVENMINIKRNKINIIELNCKPSNDQLQYWSYSLAVPKICVSSKIIQGKGVGAKQLGMPTANLEVTVELDNALQEYPNGIYMVHFSLQNMSTKWGGVASLGTNPHYENLLMSRNVEVYVHNDFGTTKFYNQIANVVLLRIIRFQGKFPDFDTFLNAMHNDIYISKMYLS